MRKERDRKGKVSMIKIWIDDERPMPKGYTWHCKTTLDAVYRLGQTYSNHYAGAPEILLDLDHDSGNQLGGDFINILKWLESWMNDPEEQDWLEGECAAGHNVIIKVHFHSANPVGIKNMRAIVEHCPWMEEV